MGVKLLKVEGDYELVVHHIRMQCEARYQWLKRYRNAVWDKIEYFYAFNISDIDRTLNQMVDSFATFATVFQPWLTNPYITHMVEVYFHSFVPNNIGSWKVFEDDRHILNFLNSTNEFTHHTIDEIQEGEEVPMIQLKSNKIPMVLAPLENLFDRSDVFHGMNKSCVDQQVDEVDINNKDNQESSKLVKDAHQKRKIRLRTW